MSPLSTRKIGARRILLTRSEDDAATWAAALERHGVGPVVLPCIDAEPIVDDALAAALREAARETEWLVFTSRRGVDAFVRLAGKDGRAAAESARIAAVGPATAAAARRALGRVDLVGEVGTAESLAAALTAAGVGGGNGKAPTRVVLALAENARDVLEKRLRAAGADVRRFDVYRTVPAPADAPKRPLSGFAVDAVWLASPSAVTGFLNQVVVDADVPLIAIGPSTAEAMRARGLAVAAEARAPSFEGLLEATP